MSKTPVTYKSSADEDVANLIILRGKGHILESVLEREIGLVKAEQELNQLNRYNELCNAYPCTLRYFDKVPLCKDGKAGPCSECTLRKIIMKE